MKRIPRIFSVMVPFLSVVLSLPMLHAEQIPHRGVEVDAEGTAAHCLTCHDGTMAGSVAACTQLCESGVSHPILKKYPPQGKESSYVPIGLLKSKGIKFENDKITCISCHDLRNHKKDQLVVDNEKGGLCMTCHIT